MFKKPLSLAVLLCFLINSLGPMPRAHAQGVAELPVPGTMVNLSQAYVPVLMKGLKVHPENPFKFDFILDTGNDKSVIVSGEAASLREAQATKQSQQEQLKKESSKLIKYFLAALTVPEKDLWVNLSPYEKDRMIADNLGQTEMGRDMLAQDYVLKQLTASLIYPEKDLGKAFWDKVYAKAQQMYGTTQIPVNTFNKVWIVADKADIFERNNVAYVVGAHLKVMLEEDYTALNKGTDANFVSGGVLPQKLGAVPSTMASQIIREIILPEIEREVNEGKNFAPLRQMFYSMILASWFKMALKDSVLAQMYGNQGKVKAGVNAEDPAEKEQIYQRYLQAYKKGVFNYIKDSDPTNVGSDATSLPRKYFSGGLSMAMATTKVLQRSQPWNSDGAMTGKLFAAGVSLRTSAPAASTPKPSSAAMTATPRLLGQRTIKVDGGEWVVSLIENTYGLFTINFGRTINKKPKEHNVTGAVFLNQAAARYVLDNLVDVPRVLIHEDKVDDLLGNKIDAVLRLGARIGEDSIKGVDRSFIMTKSLIKDFGDAEEEILSNGFYEVLLDSPARNFIRKVFIALKAKRSFREEWSGDQTMKYFFDHYSFDDWSQWRAKANRISRFIQQIQAPAVVSAAMTAPISADVVKIGDQVFNDQSREVMDVLKQLINSLDDFLNHPYDGYHQFDPGGSFRNVNLKVFFRDSKRAAILQAIKNANDRGSNGLDKHNYFNLETSLYVGEGDNNQQRLIALARQMKHKFVRLKDKIEVGIKTRAILKGMTRSVAKAVSAGNPYVLLGGTIGASGGVLVNPLLLVYMGGKLLPVYDVADVIETILYEGWLPNKHPKADTHLIVYRFRGAPRTQLNPKVINAVLNEMAAKITEDINRDGSTTRELYKERFKPVNIKISYGNQGGDRVIYLSDANGFLGVADIHTVMRVWVSAHEKLMERLLSHLPPLTAGSAAMMVKEIRGGGDSARMEMTDGSIVVVSIKRNGALRVALFSPRKNQGEVNLIENSALKPEQIKDLEALSDKDGVFVTDNGFIFIKKGWNLSAYLIGKDFRHHYVLFPINAVQMSSLIEPNLQSRFLDETSSFQNARTSGISQFEKIEFNGNSDVLIRLRQSAAPYIFNLNKLKKIILENAAMMVDIKSIFTWLNEELRKRGVDRTINVNETQISFFTRGIPADDFWSVFNLEKGIVEMGENKPGMEIPQKIWEVNITKINFGIDKKGGIVAIVNKEAVNKMQETYSSDFWSKYWPDPTRWPVSLISEDDQASLHGVTIFSEEKSVSPAMTQARIDLLQRGPLSFPNPIYSGNIHIPEGFALGGDKLLAEDVRKIQESLKKNPALLFVDDEGQMKNRVKELAKDVPAVKFLFATSAEEAEDLIRKNSIGFVVTDNQMNLFAGDTVVDQNAGLELAQGLVNTHPDLPVVLQSFGSVEVSKIPQNVLGFIHKSSIDSVFRKIFYLKPLEVSKGIPIVKQPVKSPASEGAPRKPAPTPFLAKSSYNLPDGTTMALTAGEQEALAAYIKRYNKEELYRFKKVTPEAVLMFCKQLLGEYVVIYNEGSGSVGKPELATNEIGVKHIATKFRIPGSNTPRGEENKGYGKASLEDLLKYMDSKVYVLENLTTDTDKRVSLLQGTHGMDVKTQTFVDAKGGNVIKSTDNGTFINGVKVGDALEFGDWVALYNGVITLIKIREGKLSASAFAVDGKDVWEFTDTAWVEAQLQSTSSFNISHFSSVGIGENGVLDGAFYDKEDKWFHEKSSTGSPSAKVDMAYLQASFAGKTQNKQWRKLFSAAMTGSTKPSAAMNTPTKGGIDFDRAKMQMKVSRDPSASPQDDGKPMFKIDPAMIADFKKNGAGLEFTIETIVPITNLPLLLGLRKEEEEGLQTQQLAGV